MTPGQCFPMGSARNLPKAQRTNELAGMLAQLTEAKDQMERLLARVEDVLHGVAGGSAIRRPTMASAVPARTSPLDRLNAVVASTADLREANGNVSAARVARVYGVSLSRLAGWLGRTKQAVSKTPDADSLQGALGYFERVARVRLVTGDDAGFRKWLRMPHALLGDASPLDVMARGEWQAVADYADDLLTGSPT